MKKIEMVALLLLLPSALLGQASGNPRVNPEEVHKGVVRRFYEEVWNKGNLEVADEVYSANYVRHDPRGGNPPPGPEGQKLIAAGFRKIMPDIRMTIDLLIAEGDFVVGRWTIRGTHAPTGKNVEFVGVNIFRFADGKVVEIWNHRDDLGFIQQATPPDTPK